MILSEHTSTTRQMEASLPGRGGRDMRSTQVVHGQRHEESRNEADDSNV